MQIAICDDDTIFRQTIREVLLNYKAKYRLEINIYEYESGDALLESNRVFDVIFLDYKMPGLDGMETARRLRKGNHICSIIFVTNYPEFVLESFAVQPFRFMVKPIEESLVEEAMNAYVKLQKVFFPISVLTNGEMKTIAAQDITYLEGDGKYCWIYTEKETYHSSKTLMEIHKVLPQYSFFRVHKSFVVNLFCISTIKDNLVILNSGEQLPISRTRLAGFKKAYRDFLKHNFVRI